MNKSSNFLGLWCLWAAVDGGCKVVTSVLQRYLGFEFDSYLLPLKAQDGWTIAGASLIAVLLIQFVRMLISFTRLRVTGTWKREYLNITWSSGKENDAQIKRLSSMMGLVSVLCDVVKIAAFAAFATVSLGIWTILVFSISIAASALVDHVYFGDRLTARRGVGISVFVLSTLLFFESAELLSVDLLRKEFLWVYIAAVLGLGLAANEAMARVIGTLKKKEAPATDVENFLGAWESCKLLLPIILIALLLPQVRLGLLNFPSTYATWLLSSGIGVMITLGIHARVTAYTQGVGDSITIVTKKMFSMLSYLGGMTLCDAVLFQRSFSFSVLIAMPLAGVAFWLARSKSK